MTEGKEETRRIPNDRYIIFAVPALICLILTLIAGTRWRSFRRSSRRGMALLAGTALLCAGLLGTEARADTAMLDNVTDLIRTGKTEEAVKAIDGMIALPDLPEETRQALEFAKGCLEQKAGNPKEAAEAFSQALLTPNSSLQSDSRFNLGNMEAAKATPAMTFSRLPPSTTRSMNSTHCWLKYRKPNNTARKPPNALTTPFPPTAPMKEPPPTRKKCSATTRSWMNTVSNWRN